MTDETKTETKELRIVEFDKIEADLTALEDRIGERIYDVSTPKGMKVAKADRAEVKGLRTDVEKYRQIRKKPLLEAERFLDSEAKRITARLLPVEAVPDDVIKAEERRVAEERAEAQRVDDERVAGITAALKAIREAPAAVMLCDAGEVAAAIDGLEELAVDEDTFAEFTDEALAARSGSVGQLQAFLAQKVRVERQAAELEAQREKEKPTHKIEPEAPWPDPPAPPTEPVPLRMDVGARTVQGEVLGFSGFANFAANLLSNLVYQLAVGQWIDNHGHDIRNNPSYIAARDYVDEMKTKTIKQSITCLLKHRWHSPHELEVRIERRRVPRALREMVASGEPIEVRRVKPPVGPKFKVYRWKRGQ